MTTAFPLRRVARLALKATWWAATPWRMRARLDRRHQYLLDLAATEAPLTPHDEAYAGWRAAFPLVAPRPGPAPRISLLLPGAAGNAATVATLESIGRQHVANWTAVLPATPETDTFLPGHPTVCRVPCPPGAGREAVLDALLRAAPDAHACVLDPGDLLAPEATGLLGAALDAAPGLAILHADEDAVDGRNRHREPRLKPGWSPDTLLAFNYIGRPAVLDRALALGCGGFDPDAGDGAEWALLLRMADAAANARRPIHRLPGVLCSRPVQNARERPRLGTPAAEGRRRALHAHLAPTRTNLVTETAPDGTVHATWTPPGPAPLVSVVLPARDAATLRRVLRALMDGTDGPMTEAIVVDCTGMAPDGGPGDGDPDMAALRAELADLPRIRVVDAPPGATHAAACNAGAAHAAGTVLAFLHHDLMPADPAWLAHPVRTALLPGVGPVGIPLQTADGGVRGAGGVAGPGLVGPLFRGGAPPSWGVFGAPDVPRTTLAVSGACLVVSAAAFGLVGGFDEGFRGLAAGPALCLRARRLGLRTVCVPAGPVAFDADTTADDIHDLPRLAATLRHTSTDDDPWFHPALSGHNPMPTLRVPNEPTAAEVARDAVARLVPPPADGLLDLFDDEAVLASVGRPRAELLPTLDATAPVTSPAEAALWTTELLRRRPDLRARFPHALTEGRRGAFAAWLATAPLPPGMAAHLDAMWDGDPGARPRQILNWRDDVRAAHPAALLPPGRPGIAGYLFRDAPREYGLRPEEAWWFLLAAAEDPAARLVQSFRFNVPWQAAHPLGLTVFGRDALAAWLAQEYGVLGAPAWLDPATWPGLPGPAEQLRLAWAAMPALRTGFPAALSDAAAADAMLAHLAGPSSPLPPPQRTWCAARRAEGVATELAAPAITVLGHFCYPSGLRVSAETMCDAMAAAGVAVNRRDIRLHQSDDPPHADFGGLDSAPVTLIHTQPVDLFLHSFERADLHPRTPRTHRIGYWYWELDQVPPDWAETARDADELWAATTFVADALRRTVDVPVRVMVPGVRLQPFTPRTREQLGVPGRPGERFAFLFSFHMASVSERKNPLGLVRAFRAAFRPWEPVDLVLKTTSEASHTAELATLRQAAAGANVTIIDRVLAPDETLALTAACDAYVSLHRAEGLGLTMAEAMLLGKPVIATRYSGNLDFMDDGNSLLVDFDLVTLDRAVGPYPAGTRWAQPSEAHAARLMRHLVDDRAAATALGERGRVSAEIHLSLTQAGERMAARLREIAAERAMLPNSKL